MPKQRCGLALRARVGASLVVMGAAHFYARRFEEAVPKLLLAIQEDPTHPAPYRTLAACYAHGPAGRGARGHQPPAGHLVEVIPDASYQRNPEHRELLLTGLRLATGETRYATPASLRSWPPIM